MPNGELALFRDRHDAGRRLAQRLLHYKEAKTRAFATSRGDAKWCCYCATYLSCRFCYAAMEGRMVVK
jgi:predicted phosphoribosyltransferase